MKKKQEPFRRGIVLSVLSSAFIIVGTGCDIPIEGINLPISITYPTPSGTPSPNPSPVVSPVPSPAPSSIPNPFPSFPPAPTPSPTPVPTQTPNPKRNYTTDVLLFGGDGTWADEVNSLEALLVKKQASYRLVGSAELDSMSLDDLASFGLLLFPGGIGSTITESLSSATHANLRAAVQQRGVSYLGFCAGSFVAVAPTPAPGRDAIYGFGIVDGPVLDYYYLIDQTEIAMTLETFPDGSTRDLVWYGGPVTLNKPGTTVAKYPNGDAAISQVWSGRGLVLLSAVHPAAPQSTRNAYGLRDSDGLDYALAWKLITTGLTQELLPVF